MVRSRRNTRRPIRRSRPSPRSGMNVNDRIVTIPGKIAVQFTNSSLVTSLGLYPANFLSTLNLFVNQFEEFRFVDMTIRINNPPLTFTTNFGLGYYKTLPATAPTSVLDAYSAMVSALVVPNQTCPQYMKLNRSHLLGGVRQWYNTKLTGDEGIDFTQGVLYGAFSSTTPVGTITLEISYHVEFRGRTSTNVGMDFVRPAPAPSQVVGSTTTSPVLDFTPPPHPTAGHQIVERHCCSHMA